MKQMVNQIHLLQNYQRLQKQILGTLCSHSMWYLSLDSPNHWNTIFTSVLKWLSFKRKWINQSSINQIALLQNLSLSTKYKLSHGLSLVSVF